MDLYVFLFALCLLLAGGWAILVVRRPKMQGEDWQRVKHQEAARAARRMERQRGKVWFRIDNLYAELMGKSLFAERLAEISTTPSDSPTVTITEHPATPDSFSQASVKDAFETFLRKRG